MAQQYEIRDQAEEAIRMYAAAKSYNEGIRVAMEFEQDSEILGLALMVTSIEHQLKAARYLENRKMYDDAVTLFQRAGNVEKALNICFERNNFDVLSTIADELEASGDATAEMLERCASFFMSNKQFPKGKIYISRVSQNNLT